MKTNFIKLTAILFLAGSCQVSGPENNQDNNTSTPAPETNTQTGQAAPINPDTDFILEYDVGIINGSQAPDSVEIIGNGRYFDFGPVEVQTQGHASLSGEDIRYRIKGQEEWGCRFQRRPPFLFGLRWPEVPGNRQRQQCDQPGYAPL